MEQYQMPEFAVVGATVYAEQAYGSFEAKPRKGTIVKVLKTSVDFKLAGSETVQRYNTSKYSPMLSLKGFKSGSHSAPRLISEADGLVRIEKLDSITAIRNARGRVENVSYDLAKKIRNNGMETIDALMNELKTSVEELRELLNK